MDEKRIAAGIKLLEAAQDFWDACHEEGQYGAVQWLLGGDGALVIYTRGEYREQLMANITRLSGVKPIHVFGEMLPRPE